jgi:hypothetical protein
MAVTTYYCVRPYVLQGGALVAGMLFSFRSASDAEEAVDLLEGRVAGVVHYELRGDPEFDVWDEPVWLEARGAVPKGLSRRPAA